MVDAGDEAVGCCNHVCGCTVAASLPCIGHRDHVALTVAGRVRASSACGVAFLLAHAATWWVAALLRSNTYIAVPLNRDYGSFERFFLSSLVFD